MSSEGKGPKFNTHSTGWVLPLKFDLDTLDTILEYDQEEGEIFIMTYPKCGTTWCQYIVYLLMNDCQPIPKDKTLNDYIPFIEMLGLDAVRNLPKPRAIKTHLSFEMLKYKEEPKYICVVRNPKDCCVSFFHHSRGFQQYYDFEHGSFDDFFDAFIEGQIECKDYFDHLLSLYEYKDKPNVLFLTYEDMKANPVEGVRNIANLISDLLPDVEFIDEFIKKVAEASKFDSMKGEDPSKFSGPRPENMPGFIRKGIVGDWINYFTEEQNLRMDQKFESKLSGTGAEHLWKDHGL